VLVLGALVVAAIISALFVLRRRAELATPGASVSAPVPAASARSARRTRWQPVYLSGGEAEAADGGALGAFSGRVLSSADLAPVARAEITLVEGEAAHAVVSAADGSFSFTPPREGTYAVASIGAEGFLPFSTELGASQLELVARRGRAIKNVTLYLTPAIRYQVRVVDPKNAPVEGAEVRVLDEHGETLAPDTHTSNAKGELVLHAPDGAVLEARHRAFSPGRARLDFAAQVSHRVTIRLGAPGVAEPDLSISGRVEDERGTPLGGVEVSATPDRTGSAAEPVLGARTTSGLDGSFVLGGLAASGHTLLAQEPGSAPALRRGVQAPASGIVLVLAPGGALAGRVSDGETRAPIPGFTIVISERLGPLALDTLRAETSFDAEGRYRVEPLARGRYVVVAAAHGYATSAEREVTIGEGESILDFALSRGATLSGVVRDADSRAPIERAKVSLEGRARPGTPEQGVPLSALAITDARGEFVVRGLPIGEHSILVAASGHHGKILGPFTVRGLEPLGPIEVLLAPTAQGEEPRIELYGIGAILTAQGEVLRIEKIVEGGGAAEKDLRVGDAILAVDGAPVTTLGFEGAIQRIRGPEGTYVMLAIARDGGAPTAVAVPRRRIRA
jgi:hypothetical protein